MAVKLAQMIAEDARVPKHYRDLLGGLREVRTGTKHNPPHYPQPLSLLEGQRPHGGQHLLALAAPHSAVPNRSPWAHPRHWLCEASQPGEDEGLRADPTRDFSLSLTCPWPSSQRTRPKTALRMSRWRFCAAKCKTKPSRAFLPWRSPEIRPPLTNSGLQPSAQASEDLKAVANRLGRMVYGEFDLFTEGEALLGFANTAIGRHDLFRVVGVKHHSPRYATQAHTLSLIVCHSSTHHHARRPHMHVWPVVWWKRSRMGRH